MANMNFIYFGFYNSASYRSSNDHWPLFKLKNQENELIEQRLQIWQSGPFVFELEKINTNKYFIFESENWFILNISFQRIRIKESLNFMNLSFWKVRPEYMPLYILNGTWWHCATVIEKRQVTLRREFLRLNWWHWNSLITVYTEFLYILDTCNRMRNYVGKWPS